MAIEPRNYGKDSGNAISPVVALSVILLVAGGGAWGQELPWTKNPGQTGVKRAASMKELLVNVDASHWSSFVDGEALSVNEDEALYRILFRLPRVSGYDWKRLSQPLGDARAVADDPQQARGGTFQIDGRVRSVESVPILQEVARRFEFERYYRVTIEPEGGGYPVVVCARTIPAAWEQLAPLDERASCYALFLKTGEQADGKRPLIFAADRLAWRPTAPRPDYGIESDQVLLAEYGFDVNRLQDLAGRDALPLAAADTECFYQLLAAVGRSDPAVLQARAAPFELAPVLQNPGQQHGRLFHVLGRAKRVTKILLNDPEIRDRFGIDHYYQVDVMVPLGDQEVRVPRSKSDKTGPVFNVAFPVICCVLEVPERLRAISEREDLNEDMTFDAFNVRLWSYQSQFLDQFEREQNAQQAADEGGEGAADAGKVARRRQPSPLLIARSAVFAPVAEPTDHGLGSVIAFVLLGALGLVAILVWTFQSGERGARQKLHETANASSLTFPPAPPTPTTMPDSDEPDPADSAPDETRKPS